MAAEATTLDLAPGGVHKPAAAAAPPKKSEAAKARAEKRAADRKAKAERREAAGKLRKRSIHIRADLAEGGSLHVRHMTDGSVAVTFPPIPFLADEG